MRCQDVVEIGFIFYFICSYSIYLLLNVASLCHLGTRQRRRKNQKRLLIALNLKQSLPSVTVVIPAYNEQQVIVSSVRSALNLDYPNFCICVVNDGSTDATLQTLIQAYQLVPTDCVTCPEGVHLKTKHIKNTYFSSLFSNLILVDKENGGKADALNAGLLLSDSELVCCVDADGILEPQGLKIMVDAYLQDPTRTVSVGGTVRIGNNCLVQNGLLHQVCAPKSLLVSIQVLEYLRAFLIGRMGWSLINSLLIVSGAIGIFKRQTLLDLGGYKTDLLGEDMELIVRIHRTFRAQNHPYKIVYVPDAVCWTEVPQTLAQLKKQRVRWQRGVLESLTLNKHLCFSRKGGLVGWLGFTFVFIFEGIDPFIEVLGLLYIALRILAGETHPATGLLLNVSFNLSFLLSISALCIEEVSFQTYPRFRDLLRFLLVSLLEISVYRKISTLWRLEGSWAWLFSKNKSWGTLARRGLNGPPQTVFQARSGFGVKVYYKILVNFFKNFILFLR